MFESRLWTAGAVALLGVATGAALVRWAPAGHEAVTPAVGTGVPAPTVATHGPPAVRAPDRAAPAGAVERVASVHGSAPAGRAVGLAPLTVEATPTLHVGEHGELLVGLGTDIGVGDIGFTVRFDAHLLQARAAAPGDWRAGAAGAARFAADLSEPEDSVHVRSAVSGTPRGRDGGVVAVVQFQAMAQGSATIRITDVTVHDLAGQPMPHTIRPASVQVTMLAAPPPEAAQPSAVAVPVRTDDAGVDNDD